MTTTKHKCGPKDQVTKFREAARKAGANNSEEHFNATLRGLAKARPPKTATGEPGASDPNRRNSKDD
jgi:hypothetical protein